MSNQTTKPPEQQTSVKETLTSIIIAFAMAFVFRGFVVEAFVIPTGSMAPTLLGAHMNFKSPFSGYEWTVGPTQFRDNQMQVPVAVQPNVKVTDPMTGQTVSRAQVPTSWGDRIFVMKYLYSVYDPKRWDVVVFKNPNDPNQNYIKRLLGLPNEMLAIVDGDVFTHPFDAKNPPSDDERFWLGTGWKVARKPEAAQRAMWQPVFNSEYAPISNNALQFSAPWIPSDSTAGKWKIGDRKDYEYEGAEPTILSWDARRRIDDEVAYNELFRTRTSSFPVSDIRLSLGVRPKAEGQRVAAVVTARGHEFRAEVAGADVTLEMRTAPGDGKTPDSDWKLLAQAKLDKPLEAGKVTNIDFWHVDQSMHLYINDHRVAYAEYDWGPSERIEWATTRDARYVKDLPQFLTDGRNYKPASARFEFSGGGFTLYRVSLERDIHYQAATYSSNNPAQIDQPAKATAPKSTAILGADQFFTCGDNSPMSLDARLWGPPNPWVAQLDPTTGVVHRDLLIGKAFLVYFPAPKREGFRFAPDVGDMRFIW